VLLIADMCPCSLEINISSSLFCTSGEETVQNLKIWRGQLAPCQEKRIKRQQTVSSTRCQVLAQNAGFLLASMPSYCRFKPIECSYLESVSVSVSQDKIRGSAIRSLSWEPCQSDFKRSDAFQSLFHARCCGCVVLYSGYTSSSH